MRLAPRPHLPIVFISATSKDLIAHRQKVIQTLKNRGYGLITMEEFDAESADAVEVSLKYIPDCHVFVGIYAFRYGYIPKGRTRGVTELEYREAQGLDKPRLLFVVDKDHPFDPTDPILQHRDDTDTVKAEKLQAFKNYVGEKLVWKTFATPDDLAAKVLSALATWEDWRVLKPAQPSRVYIGRHAERAKIAQLLDEHPQVALLGMGGIGKTFTAQQIAYELRDRYTGGVLWLQFGSEEKDGKLLIQRTMEAWAELHKEGRIFPLDKLTPEQVKTWLSEAKGRLLIVFDDVWHIKAARELAKLVPDNAALLITTSHHDTAQSLNIPDRARVEITQLTDVEGVQLLRDRVGTGPQEKALHEIVGVVGGHPLALEIAAAQIVENGDDYADQLPDLIRAQLAEQPKFDLLDIPDEERTLSVIGVLNLSYQQLSQDMRRRFRALGVLAMDARLPVALLAGVWGDEALLPDRVQAFVSKGILSGAKDSDTPTLETYALHRILLFYARALLAENADERAEVSIRYILTVIQHSHLTFAEPPETWHAFETAWETHIYVVGVAIGQLMHPVLADLPDLTQPTRPDRLPTLADKDEGLCQAALQFARAISPYVIRRYIGEIGRDWQRMGLAAARLLHERQAEAGLLNELGVWHDHQGEKQQAIAYYGAKLPIDHELGDQAGEAATLTNLGAVHSDLGDKATALQFFEQALSLFRLVGNKSGEASTLNNLGMVYADLGDKARALHYYEQALPLRRLVGDKSGEATILSNLGLIYSALGDKARALHYYEQALPLQRLVGDKSGEAITLSSLGVVYDDLGDKPKALHYYEQALPLRRLVGDKSGEATTLTNLGVVYDELGDKQKALHYYEQALPLRRLVGDKSGEAATLNNLGMAYADLGDKARALHYYEQALPLQRLVGDKSGEATTLNNLGSVYDDLGDKPSAIQFFEQTLQIVREIGDKAREAGVLNNIASVYFSTGQPDKARAYLDQSLPLRRAVGDRDGEAYTLFNMSYLVADHNEAITLVQQAYDLWVAVQSPAATDAAKRLTELRGNTHPPNDPLLDTIVQTFEEATTAIRAQLEADPPSITEAEQRQAVFDTLHRLYHEKGAEAVREVLRANEIPPETIEEIVKELEQHSHEEDGGVALDLGELLTAYAENGAAGVRAYLVVKGVPEHHHAEIVAQVAEHQNQADQTQAFLKDLYDTQGEAAVRTLLHENNVPDAVIEVLIAGLKD